mmetsp:Transcript_13646/g.18709  ORF Transcript_13646/g.18709 Transcript_13646/m.18709 type:complete len:521 (+) Transcript_13646:108-1670(+)
MTIRTGVGLAFKNEGSQWMPSHHSRSLLSSGLDGDNLTHQNKYRSNEELEFFLRAFTAPQACGSISRFFSIGKSVQGRDLWVLEISDSPGEEQAGEPNFKYVANMHGDEPLGRELLLRLASWLCDQYLGPEPAPQAKRLVEDMHLFMLVSMNPDGFVQRSRTNAGRKDLNRDFPDQFSIGSGGVHRSSWGKRQPETASLMRWTLTTPFVGALNFHEGALVANYPLDGSHNRRSEYSKAPEDAALRHLALAYAGPHQAMRESKQFPNGVTNGAHWYPIFGGMQDWDYLVGKCMDITVEQHHRKWPDPALLPKFFEEHRASMLEVPLVAAFGGLRGFVLSSNRVPLPAARVDVKGPVLLGSNFTPHISPKFGHFHRPLAPGDYIVTIQHPGFQTQTFPIQIPSNNSGFMLDVTLQPAEVTFLGESNLVSTSTNSLHIQLDKTAELRDLGVSVDKPGNATQSGQLRNLPANEIPMLTHDGGVWSLSFFVFFVLVSCVFRCLNNKRKRRILLPIFRDSPRKIAQ